MYEQSCNLRKRKIVLQQYERNIFKSNAFMLSILFIYIFLKFLTITFETCNNVNLKTKAPFRLYEKFFIKVFESRNENIVFLKLEN